MLDKIPELKRAIYERGGIDSYIIMVNGIHIHFRNGVKTILKEGDEVDIFPPGAGGSS